MPTDPPDLSDAAENLEDLIAAAEAAPPASVEGDAAQARLAEVGIAMLQALPADIKIATSDEDRKNLVSDLLEHRKAQAVRAALHVRWPEANRLRLRLRNIKGMASVVDDVFGAIEKGNGRRSTNLDALLKPLGIKGLVAPEGYSVTSAGVWQEGVQAARASLVVAGVAEDVQSGAARLELAWLRGSTWNREWVDRDEAMDARRLIRLAGLGAPVGSDNNREVVRYLAAFEAENLTRLPWARTTERCGWHDGFKAFVLPDQTVGDDIRLTTRNVGTLTRGFGEAGTWEGWCAAIGRVRNQPLAMLGLYASVAGPLLKLLGQQGFVIDWSGGTSQGKTSSLRVGASVWGLPCTSEGIIHSWDVASTVGPLTAAALYCHLPMFRDDTKNCEKHDVLAQCCYLIPSGRDRERGRAEGGLRDGKSWCLPLLSTGEAPITAYIGSGGGAYARVISVRGTPLAGRAQAQRLERDLKANYGHLGRRLLRHLIEHADHQELRAKHARLRDLYAEQFETEVQGRMAAYVAALEVARGLCELLGVPAPDEEHDPIAVALESIERGGREADRPAEALRDLVSWATANEWRFNGREDDKRPCELVGQWASASPRFLGVRVTVLKGLLREWNYDGPNVMAAWHQRGWTIHNTGRPDLKVRKINDSKSSMHVVAVATEWIEKIAADASESAD